MAWLGFYCFCNWYTDELHLIRTVQSSASTSRGLGFSSKKFSLGRAGVVRDAIRIRNPMNAAIDNLYATFSHYQIGNDFAGCDCCVGPEHSAKLAATPLGELTFSDLERYSRKAITTWGNVGHFKYFLPRLWELTIQHRDDFLDLAMVFGKLKPAQFESWPQIERDAVNRFFDEYWNHQLVVPIESCYDDSIDLVLCALSNAVSSVQRFLDMWIFNRADNAKQHLAAFILNNDDMLLKKARLSNAFWDATGRTHAEVLSWLQSEALLRYLGDVDDSVMAGDFSNALPQLMAIRSFLAVARK